MNESRFFLDIHAIQTLPPSNANRDDTGSPKTAVYGGVRQIFSIFFKNLRKIWASEAQLLSDT